MNLVLLMTHKTGLPLSESRYLLIILTLLSGIMMFCVISSRFLTSFEMKDYF